MSPRFCRHFGGPILVGANFCKHCGNPLQSNLKATERTLKGGKAEQATGSSHKSVSKVPEWNTYYPSLSDATEEQKAFYAFWKDNLERGMVVDIDGNLSYLFVYAYDAIYRFVADKEIGSLVASFERLKKGYSNYEKVAYLDRWLADAWLYINNYDAAWQMLRHASKLRLDEVLNIRAKCSDTTIDGHDLLAITGNSGLTKFGRAHREEIANIVTTFLADFQRAHGMNFIEHFAKQFNPSGIIQSDIDKLESYFPKEKEFARLKWEWQFEQRHPRPKESKICLFSGVPFGPSFPIQIEFDPSTGDVGILNDNSVERPCIASEELPTILELALFYEIKKKLRECEKTLKEEIKRGPSSD